MNAQFVEDDHPLERNEKAIDINRNDCNLRGTAKVFICSGFHLKKQHLHAHDGENIQPQAPEHQRFYQ
jgi:hypothetical protein